MGISLITVRRAALPADASRNEVLMKVPVKITIFALIAFIIIASALAVVGCKKAKPDSTTQIEKDVQDAESPVAPIMGD